MESRNTRVVEGVEVSRIVKEDSIKLLTFFENYSVANVVGQEDFQDLLKKLHKSYFALLVFGAEFDLKIEKDDIAINDLSISNLSNNHLHLKEAFSDFGSALFCWVNGAYKNSEMSARSSIENFVRSIASIEDQNILTEKNVYKIFDASKKTFIFSDKRIKSFFSEIYGNYSKLCITVHTGDIRKISNVSGMNNFPVFDNNRAIYSMTLIKSSMDLILKMLVFIFSDIYHNSHRRNKEIIDLMLPSSIKKYLHGAD